MSDAAASQVILLADADHVTTKFGTWRIIAARGSGGEEHVVMTMGNLLERSAVLCRVASECVTSTALFSAQCDCAQQIEESLRVINEAGHGLLIYLRQEGRGHGLATKIEALNHKNEGLDTFAAVERLGLPSDVRQYHDAASILSLLSIRSIVLITNNPEKIEALERLAVTIEAVLPVVAKETPDTAIHLRAKRARGHTV
jgi:GTP cyclohydrolase II